MKFWVGFSVFLVGASAIAGQSSNMPGDMLKAHNSYRVQAGVPRLMWSDGLAVAARRWATRLIQQNRFGPDPASHFGQNAFEIDGGSASPSDVVRAWMSESKNYDRRTNICQGRCGHYTQVVWRATKQVGCGMARGNGREIWVCDYDPPGNIVGERPY